MVNNVAQLIDDSYVRATNDLKRDTDYYCPSCKKLIHVVKSEIKQPHFRHKKGESCIWVNIHKKYMENGRVKKNIRESTLHKIMKEIMFSFFDDEGKKYYAEKEHNFDFGSIADVYVKDLNLAIECEYKHLTWNDMLNKIEKYAKKNIRCLYVFYIEKDEKIAPSKQKILDFIKEHYGQVIFMDETLNLNIIPNTIVFSEGTMLIKDRHECNKICTKDYYCPYMERVISKNGRYYSACLCSSFLHNEKQYYKNIKNTYEIISYSNYRKINYKSVFFKE